MTHSKKIEIKTLKKIKQFPQNIKSREEKKLALQKMHFLAKEKQKMDSTKKIVPEQFSDIILKARKHLL